MIWYIILFILGILTGYYLSKNECQKEINKEKEISAMKDERIADLSTALNNRQSFMNVPKMTY